MTKEMSEEHRQGILASVSKFLNRDNLYASVNVTYPHTPSIHIDSIGDTNSNDIVNLRFCEKSDFINGKGERKLCLVADYWVETKILWHSAWLPMEQFPEAYKMFLNKYEQLDGEKKATKEEIEEYRKELEMWEDKKYEETQKKIETELIINNAFEFLKMDDLIVTNPDIDMVANKSKYINNDVCSITIINKIIDIQYYKDKKYYTLSLPSNEYTELYNAIMQRYNELLKLAEVKREQTEQPQDTTDYTIKYDQNKPKLSQFPREAMEAVAEVMEYGARKYGKGTWSRVEIQRYIDAGARHLYAMQDIDENGKECINLSKIDKESGLEHLYHLACNAVYAVALYKRGKRNETR